jgi:predicted NBD/HSP70 family sugar kinase
VFIRKIASSHDRKIPGIPMLLAIDIGNTNIVVGVFDEDRLLHSWRLSTQPQRTADEMGMFVLQLFQHGTSTGWCWPRSCRR